MRILLLILTLSTFSLPAYSKDLTAAEEVIHTLVNDRTFQLNFVFRMDIDMQNNAAYGSTMTLQSNDANDVHAKFNVWVQGQPHHFTMELSECGIESADRIVCQQTVGEKMLPVYLKIVRLSYTALIEVQTTNLVLKAAQPCSPKAVNCASEYIWTRQDLERLPRMMLISRKGLKKQIDENYNPKLKK